MFFCTEKQVKTLAFMFSDKQTKITIKFGTAKSINTAHNNMLKYTFNTDYKY